MIVADLGPGAVGKASESYDREGDFAARREFGGGDGWADRVRRDTGFELSSGVGFGGEGEVGVTHVGQRTIRGVLRGSCWVQESESECECEWECDSDGDEEYGSEEEDSSEEEVVESSKDRGERRDGGDSPEDI